MMTGELTQVGAIALMLNNYIHDVATGLLVLSALWLGWTARDLGDEPEAAAIRLFQSGYRRSIHFVFGSIAVIIVTGVIRTLNFMRFEWIPAVGRALIPVLVLKHVLIFTMLAAGGYAWYNLRRRVAQIKGWGDDQGS